MFDYAISHNQRRKPTGRHFTATLASCLIHLTLLLVLIENPWLLKGGIYHHFRGFLLSPNNTTEYVEEEDYRTIAVLRPMVAPSAEELNRILHPGDNGDEAGDRARWGNDELTAPDEAISISTTIEAKPEPTPAGVEDATDLADSLENTAAEPEGIPEAPLPDLVEENPEPADNEEAITPVTDAPSGDDVASNIAPSRIPDTIPPPEDNSTAESFNVFETEQQALDSRKAGFFDVPQGYPLKEYASLIKQRVTRNWNIPSNLRYSEGHTTIVFFIDRNGQHFGARIIESSGNNSLNITALNAVISSNPFPPLPQGFPGDHVGVKYVFIPEPQ